MSQTYRPGRHFLQIRGIWMTLLGAAGLALPLMAVPAYARSAGVTGGGGAGDAGTRVTANGPGTADNTATIGMAGSNAAVIGNGHYANVGFGSYTGEKFYITAGDGNNYNGRNYNNNWRPSQRNPLLADNGDARASTVIGTAVYNSVNQKLGNINDILIGTNGVYAVIATNNKQVAVPFGDLMFGNATNQGNEKVVMPNETEARLNALPVFHSNVTNYPGVTANSLNAANFAGGYGNGALGTTGSNAGVGVYTTGGKAGGGPYGGTNPGGLAMGADGGGAGNASQNGGRRADGNR